MPAKRRKPVAPTPPKTAPRTAPAPLPPPPSRTVAPCPACGNETEHVLLKGRSTRGGGVDGKMRCTECEDVHVITLRGAPLIQVPFIISKDESSTRTTIELRGDDQVAHADEIEVDGGRVDVTIIELKDGRRVTRARVDEIRTLWGKDVTVVKVGFSINLGPVTRTFESPFGPEAAVAIGDTFELEGQDVAVERIITDEGARFTGSYNVRDIKRAWLKRVRPGPPFSAPAPPYSDRASHPPRKAAPGGGRGRPREGGAGGDDEQGGYPRPPVRGRPAYTRGPRPDGPTGRRRPPGAGSSRRDGRPAGRPGGRSPSSEHGAARSARKRPRNH